MTTFAKGDPIEAHIGGCGQRATVDLVERLPHSGQTLLVVVTVDGQRAAIHAEQARKVRP